jgi:hypothetical protein
MIDRFGQLSVVEALACTLLTPVAEPVAVFVNALRLQLWPVVVALMTAVIVPFGARSSGPQASVPLVMAQLAPAGLELPSEYVTPVTTGNGSLIAAAYAVPAPLLVSVTVHENGLPAATVCVAGVFVMPMLGQLMIVVAVACTLLRPVAAPVAVFEMPLALQLVPFVVVALMMATVVAPAARFFDVHVSCVPAPLIEHVASLPAPSVYATPVSCGSGSLIVLPTAVPVPLLVNVTVHENGLPLSTVCVAGVFVISSLGQLMIVVAVACTLLTPVAAPVAVLTMPLSLQLVPAVVVALMTATSVAFFARFFGPQVSVPAVIAHVASLPAPSV